MTVVVLELALIEAAHLTDLVEQFAALVGETPAAEDPAVARLVPDAYADDEAAAREFRELTERDLLERRRADAGIVLGSLSPAASFADADDPMEVVHLTLDADAVQAWLRALAAIRLVLANRLGIESEDDHDDEDPRFGIYDWLGYRLDGLVRAVENET